jgi:hypothetical protein
MADAPKNYKQVLTTFKAQPNNIREYFEDFPELVENFEWGVSISYVFSRIEIAKHRTLYGGLVKLHGTSAKKTSAALDKHQMKRKQFVELFSVIFGTAIEKATLEKLSEAEAIRDKVAHGKPLTDAQARKCLADALEFAAAFDEFVSKLPQGFSPFGNMQGFKGAKAALSDKTTYWVLKGMGIVGPGSFADAVEDG